MEKLKDIHAMNLQDLLKELNDIGVETNVPFTMSDLIEKVKAKRLLGLNWIKGLDKSIIESVETISHATKLLSEYEVTIKTLCRIFGGK